MEAIVTKKGFKIKKRKLLKNLKQQEEKNSILLERNKQLEAAIEQAERINQIKSEFFSHISHDIRTPINGIVGMTSIAMKYPDRKDRVLDCLKKIDDSSKHLISLLNDILDMSRIESGKTIMNYEPMDMQKIMESCACLIEGLLSNRDVTFVREFAIWKHPMLMGDELHLRQILINILGNAVKFTPDGGKIYFQVKESSSCCGKAVYHFEIEDTGIGMKPSFLETIWEAFSQEKYENYSNYKGTGLGMAITKRLVDLMGGRITVESKLGVGSRFVVEIAFDIDSNFREKADVRKESQFSLKGKKVLVVEDIELNREIVQILLGEEGVDITIAENGQLAVNIFNNSQANTFDAILMDVRMPIMDGLSATRTIRALPRIDALTIPIIAMTADAYEEDIRKALEAGMNDHLSKPINLEHLLQRLRTFCIEKGGQKQ